MCEAVRDAGDARAFDCARELPVVGWDAQNAA